MSTKGDFWSLLAEQDSNAKHEFGLWCAWELVDILKQFPFPVSAREALLAKRNWMDGKIPEAELQTHYDAVEDDMYMSMLNYVGNQRNLMVSLCACARANATVSSMDASKFAMYEFLAVWRILFFDVGGEKAYKAAIEHLKQKGQEP